MRSRSIDPAMRTAVTPESFAAFSLNGVAASAGCDSIAPSKQSSIHKIRIIQTSEKLKSKP